MARSNLEDLKFPSITITKNHEVSALLSRDVCTRRINPPRCSFGLDGPPIQEFVSMACKPEARFRDKYVQVLSALLYEANIIIGAKTEPEHGIAAMTIPRKGSAYSMAQRYKSNDAGLGVWTAVVDALCRKGLLKQLFRGYKTANHPQGLSSTYQPTDAMRGWLSDNSQALKVVSLSSQPETVLLTVGKAKKLTDYPESEYSTAIRNQLAAVSSLFDRQTITLPDEHGMHRSIPEGYFKPQRTFRDDFQSGGRAYCAAQRMSGDLRKQLHFNGEPCVEWDYSSHQPRMLYHLNGLEAPDDCYDHDIIPRAIMKAAMTRVMNCKNDSQGLGSLRKLLTGCSDQMSPEGLLEAVYQSHPLVKQSMGPDLWKKLQYKESSIALKIMERLADNRVCCLGVHDSFVVAQAHGQLLQELMREEYQKQIGFEPVLKVA